MEEHDDTPDEQKQNLARIRAVARGLGSLPRRAPVAFYYCILSIAWDFIRPISLTLHSEDLARTFGQAIIPHNLIGYIRIVPFLLLLAWHLEPRLGLVRSFLLLAASAFAGATWYIVVNASGTFAGPVFILYGYAAAFFTWFVRSRAVLPPCFKLSWAIPPIAILVLFTIESTLAGASVCAFAIGTVIGLTAERAST
jgi:hypothetical protein